MLVDNDETGHTHTPHSAPTQSDEHRLCFDFVSREITTLKFMLISPTNHSEDDDKK